MNTMPLEGMILKHARWTENFAKRLDLSIDVTFESGIKNIHFGPRTWERTVPAHIGVNGLNLYLNSSSQCKFDIY